eukprot:11026284-Alexandrium_andersonii.AAC.1
MTKHISCMVKSVRLGSVRRPRCYGRLALWPRADTPPQRLTGASFLLPPNRRGPLGEDAFAQQLGA